MHFESEMPAMLQQLLCLSTSQLLPPAQYSQLLYKLLNFLGHDPKEAACILKAVCILNDVGGGLAEV